MPKAIESFTFRVAGVTNYKKAVKAACSDIADEYGVPELTKYYRDLSSSEIREELEGFSDKIFKYEDMSTSDVELVAEPDNQYDPNAIKILILDNFVGYVPAKIAKKINKYIVDDQYFDTAYAEIVGGPYKEFDYAEDKVVTNNDLDVGFEIALTIYDSTQTEMHVSVEPTQVREQSTESIPRIVNVEGNIKEKRIENTDNNIRKATESIDYTAYFEMLDKQKKARQKTLFALLYGFLALFGLGGISIFPLLAVPLTAWSIYRFIKLFKK
ncbi:HIRAN domain-containing protein [Streptococcus suis]|uniref:HIRAN domain-containing protein n=1 Tax=Streptococcus suis TaxID=1307 RepID=UPI001FF4A1F3|nr:HIRAN domain-containing protein [Streptococcus suis]MCK1259856.1 HIRAN domain-containing protein [Streptococcus suis]